MKIKRIKENRKFTFEGDKKTRAYASDTGSTGINGYYATFNTPSKILVDWDESGLITFQEVLEPGCFDDVLASPGLDCTYNVDHDDSRMISRTKSGTLKLKADDFGLFGDTPSLPDTTIARDLVGNIKFGNYTENSFCFTVPPDGERWEVIDGQDYRYITKVDGLYDVSTVVNPAYPGTKISLRALDHFKTRSLALPLTPAPVETPPSPVVNSDQSEPNPNFDALETEIYLLKAKQ